MIKPYLEEYALFKNWFPCDYAMTSDYVSIGIRTISVSDLHAVPVQIVYTPG